MRIAILLQPVYVLVIFFNYIADNELVRFLNETKKAELTLSWLEKCQKVFVGVLSSRADQILGNCRLTIHFTHF